jgi:transposase
VTERDALVTERDAFAAKVAEQSSQIVWLRRMLFGRKSEKLSAEELGQLVLAYGGTEAEATTPDPTLPVPALDEVSEPEEGRPKGDKSGKHRGRTKLSAELKRIVTEVPVAADERSCTQCGTEMVCFGHVEHERLEFIPAKFVVHVERREKLACKACKGDAVTAERHSPPVLPLRVGPSVLAYLIESKCDDALPIYRQCDQFVRLGFELPATTAYGYWKYATDLLLPVSDALLGTVLAHEGWIGVDDTRLDVLDKKRKGGKYRGHLWCFVTSTGLVAYRFTETWEAKDIAPWFQLIGPQTYIQVDDYAGYSTLVHDASGHKVAVVPPERRLGCMMHVRRRFYDALKAGDKRATQPVKWIQELYKVEELARGRPPDERLSLRQEHSQTRLDAFDAWVDVQYPRLGKTGKLAEAVRYAKQQRPFVRRCFTDGCFEIDNGAVERAIKEPAIGRKNFLFTGSAPAGQRLAAAYSIVQTCRALGIPTRDYLIDIITKLEAGWPARRLTELLPHCWAEHRPL